MKCFGEFRARLLNRRAFFLVEGGRFQEAVVLLKKAIYLSPNNPHNYNELCICFGRLSRLDLAESMARKAIDLDSYNPKFRNGLIGILLDSAILLKSRAEIVEKLIEVNYQIDLLLKKDPAYTPAHLAKAQTSALCGASQKLWEAELENAVVGYRSVGQTASGSVADEPRIQWIISSNRERCLFLGTIWEKLPENNPQVKKGAVK
ncbi:hypothetical protein KKE19_02395 [Patescibacteria group bacterium]|nr:hypothetical protein [Patescibacteria group bacterium]MBU4274639.1 hypothetical protein [Patescibacteria group bacterium]MBU4367685.1 hypothetical protein [Patescibacteria group bacterium]MBU4461865.1 hypothetical protein [Patescibacteria group bacterium]MCG2700004.1 hypothetical protein [Candidatus Parcubacteria bacterium]